MEEHKRHETSKESRKVIKFILIGISALTLLSAFSVPRDLLTTNEMLLSLAGLVFVNGFLIWIYHVLFVWKQRVFKYWEQKYQLKIEGNPAGSYNIVGEGSILLKFTIHLQVFLYFILGILGPLALFIGGILWFR